MEEEPKASGGCSAKSIFKCCLFYFTSLLILTLIFTGANNEPKDERQTRWWWAFIATLLATASMSATALAILIYTDFYRAPMVDEEQKTNSLSPRPRRGKVQAAQEMSDSLKTDVPIDRPSQNSMTMNENALEDSGYLGKTVKDISRQQQQQQQETSTDPNRPVMPLTDNMNEPAETSQSGFVNMTPSSAKSPVTVVDMTASRKKPRDNRSRSRKQITKALGFDRGRLDQPTNLASLTSNVMQDEQKKRKKRAQLKGKMLNKDTGQL